MTREQLRILQKLQLKIALEVKRICEKHEIRYFLDCGSMLGAVRHNGFIPWDDDMDIGFLREDYNKFLSVARNELGKEFCLLTWECPEYPFPYAKVCLKETVYKERIAGNSIATHNNIFIDIFPYDNISDDKNIRFLNGACRKIISHMLMIKCSYRVWVRDGIGKKVKFIPLMLLSRFFSKKYLKSVFMKLACQYNDIETYEVGIEDVILSCNYKRKDLLSFVEVKFEDELFVIPQEYDAILKIAYGDYMELPPEEKRWIGHDIVKIDFGPYERE